MQERWEIPEAPKEPIPPEDFPVVEGERIDRKKIASAKHCVKFAMPEVDGSTEDEIMEKLLQKRGNLENLQRAVRAMIALL